jgi:hypothetical protein
MLSYLNDTQPTGQKVCIRILLADPGSFGARLLSRSESGVQPGGLSQDVLFAARYFGKRESETKGKNRKAELEVRLYRLMPHSFICYTNSCVFVQPYYFWRAEQYGRHAPLLKFSYGSEMYKETGGHFDLIWNHASFPVGEFLNGAAAGVEAGAMDTGLVNLYRDREKAELRMRWLLEPWQMIHPPRLRIRLLRDGSYAECFGTLCPGARLELNLVTFSQAPVAITCDVREVYEEILRAVFRTYKAIPLGVVEPLDCSGCH